MTLKEKLHNAILCDREIITESSKIEETLGSDAHYLEDILELTNSNMKKLEKLGVAIRARYATENKRKRIIKWADESVTEVTGPHRIRWIIIKEKAYEMCGM